MDFESQKVWLITETIKKCVKQCKISECNISASALFFECFIFDECFIFEWNISWVLYFRSALFLMSALFLNAIFLECNISSRIERNWASAATQWRGPYFAKASVHSLTCYSPKRKLQTCHFFDFQSCNLILSRVLYFYRVLYFWVEY